MILTEPQGVASAAAVNTGAEIVVVESWSDFETVWDQVQGAKPIKLENGQHAAFVTWREGGNSTFQTLVIDSITDLQQMMIDHMQQGGKGGLEQKPLTQQQWGRLMNTMTGVMRQQRNLPVSVVMTALANEKHEATRAGDVRRVTPMLMGQMAHKLGQYCNAVAYATQDKGGQPALVWKQDARFHSKPAPGFPGLTRHSLEPGVGTLGSLLLSLWDGPATPRAEGDSKTKAEGVRPQSSTAESNK